MNSPRTRVQSHSSSSATSMARPVRMPWPISARAMRMTTVSSGRIVSQAVTSAASPASPASAGANGIASARVSPPPTALIPARKERRLSGSPDVIALPFQPPVDKRELGRIATQSRRSASAEPTLSPIILTNMQWQATPACAAAGETRALRHDRLASWARTPRVTAQSTKARQPITATTPATGQAERPR